MISARLKVQSKNHPTACYKKHFIEIGYAYYSCIKRHLTRTIIQRINICLPHAESLFESKIIKMAKTYL